MEKVFHDIGPYDPQLRWRVIYVENGIERSASFVYNFQAVQFMDKIMIGFKRIEEIPKEER
jgi:hypothetical protein